MLEANNDRMSSVDRLEHVEDWTRCLAKGYMNFDVKLNALDKALTRKVFNKPVSSMLQARLIYQNLCDFPHQGEQSRVKRERDKNRLPGLTH